MNLPFTIFEKVTMNDKSFALDLLDMYIGELEDYLQQLPGIVSAKDMGAYRFLNHKVRSMINTLEATLLLEAQSNLQQQLAKGAPQQDISEMQQKLVGLTRQLIKILEERKKYYAKLDNHLA
jgi:HPt (histidine-containing phosphotransfer) domain-containing protein